ncbi:MAG TPA: iron ABC transporter substrate-binding protein [Candidatus Bipolaricaulota bacterium]
MQYKLFALSALIVLSAALPDMSPAVAAQDTTLVIYSGRSESLVGPIIQQFTIATGINVDVRYGDTAQLAATLLEEGERSPADLFYAQDPGGLGAVEGLLAPLPQTVLDQAPEPFRSPQGLWVGISARARTLVYNTNVLSEAELPDDIYDLIDPKWKGRLGWAPTNASFQAMVTGMRALWGEEKTRAWLEGVLANGPTAYSGNAPQVEAVGKGEIDVGMVNHYYLFRFLATEGDRFPARNYHPRAGGPGALVMVSGAGILKTAQHREAAERLIAFMLSQVAQQYFTSSTFEYPVVAGVQTNRLLVPLDQINAPDLALSDLADLAGTQTLLQEVGVLP